MGRVNLKKGLFRLWILTATAWVALALGFSVIGEEARYTYRYYFQYDQLQDEARAAHWQQVVQYLPLASSLEAPHDPRRDTPPPRQASFTWLYALLLVPTLGVAVAGLALYAAIKGILALYGWIANGFRS